MWDCGRLKLPLWMNSLCQTTSTAQRQFDVQLWTFRTWNLLFARECFLIKNFQKLHNYGRLWYIVRFVSLLCPMPLNFCGRQSRVT
jgi:hypothetical protein